MFGDISTKRKVFSAISKCALVRNGAIHTCIAEELDDNNYSLDDSSPQSRGTPSTIVKSMLGLSMGQKARSRWRFHTGKSFISLLSSFLFILLLLFNL